VRADDVADQLVHARTGRAVRRRSRRPVPGCSGRVVPPAGHGLGSRQSPSRLELRMTNSPWARSMSARSSLITPATRIPVAAIRPITVSRVTGSSAPR
jgi:hypothetical protein